LHKLVSDYEVINFDIPPGSFGTRVLGVNDHGDFVGFSSEPFSGFLYQKGKTSVVHVPGSSFDEVSGINNSGVIVGKYVDKATDTSHAFIYEAEKFTTLEPPAAKSSAAYGINDRGDVVGFYQDSRGVGRGFLYTNKSFVEIDFPGVFDTRATGINNKGQIVGFYVQPKDKRFRGFIYEKGIFTTIDYPAPDAIHTRLLGINVAGDIVGFCLCGPQRLRGFLYRNGVFTDIQFSDGTPTFPNGINRHGVVVGFYSGSDGGHGFFAVPRKR